MLTGWFAGPKTDRVSSLTETELVDMGLASPAEIFDLPVIQQSLRGTVVTPLCRLNNNDVGRDGNGDGMPPLSAVPV